MTYTDSMRVEGKLSRETKGITVGEKKKGKRAYKKENMLHGHCILV